MNTPYNIILSNNINRGNALNYKKVSSDIEQQRNDFFAVFNKLKNDSFKQEKMQKTYAGQSSITSMPYSELKQSDVVERLNRLNRVEQNGWIYEFDLETIGTDKAPSVMSKNRAMQSIHQKNATITEMAIWKVQVKDGKAVKNSRVRVDNFMTAPSLEESVSYISKMLHNNVGDSSTASALARYAGYGSEEAVWINGMIEKFDNNANISDVKIIERGAARLAENVEKSGYIKGTDKYVQKMRSTLDFFEEIANSDNTLIAGANIEKFDIPMLKEVIRQALPSNESERVNSVFEKINKIAFDQQLVAEHTIAETIYKDQTAIREKLTREADEIDKRILSMQKGAQSPDIKLKIASDQLRVSELRKKASLIDNNLTLSSMVTAASNRDSGITLLEAHTASPDTEASTKVLETYLPDYIEARDIANAEMVSSSTERSLYKAQNRSYIANADDIFFSLEDGNVNTYNPVLMEKGHTYKVENFSFSGMEGVNPELADKFRDKDILRITDLYDGYDRQSFIAYDKGTNKMQDIIDSAYITRVSDNKTTRSTVNKETARAISDKTRVKHENFFKVNSNEGFSKFNKMFGTYEEFNNISDTLGTGKTKQAFEEAVKSGIFRDASGNIIESELAQSFGQSLKNSYSVDFGNISENARNIINFYDDFDKNRNTYGRMMDAVSGVLGVPGDVVSSITKYGDEKIYRGSTAVFSKARQTIENELYSSAKESDILDYIVGNSGRMSNNYSKMIKNYIKENNGGIYSKELEKRLNNYTKRGFKRKAFENITGENFSKENEIVKRMSFGDTLSKDFDFSSNTLDILNSNGEYTRIDSTNLSSMKEKINSTVNRLADPNKNGKVSERLRSNLLNEMSNDLLSRKIITQDDFDLIKSQNKNKSKIEILSRRLHGSKRKFDELVLKTTNLKDVSNVPVNKINYSKLDAEEATYVRNYINNMQKRDVLSRANSMEFLGKGFDEIADESVITKALSNLSFNENNVYGHIGDDLSKDITNSLKESLNWEDKHVEIFMNDIINNKENKTFNYVNRTEQPANNGLTQRIFTKDDDVYMMVSSKDKEKMIYDMLNNGVELDDISKHGALVRLPKIVDMNGVKSVKQGDSVYKAVTKDIIGRSVNIDENGLSIMVQDTVETLLKDMGRSIKYTKNSLEKGLIPRANSSMNRGWRNINEEKALTGSGYIAKEIDGVMNIVKRQSINRSDYMMRGLINVDKIASILPTVFSGSADSQLANSLADEFTQLTDSDFGSFIKNLNAKLNQNKELSFSDLGVKEKTWFIKNISGISELALNDSNIQFKNSSRAYFERMRDNGLTGFLLKDSGEVTKGFYNQLSPLDFNPGSRYSDTSRPLINQLLNADVVSEDSMNVMLKNYGYDSVAKRIANGENIFDVLNIKRGASYTTASVSMLENYLSETNEMLSLSVRRKVMDEIEFANYGDSLISSNKSVNGIVNDLSKKNIKATDDEVRAALKKIFTTSNLYEDHGLSKISLGMAFGNKSIISETVDKGFRYKIGDYITDGTILNEQNGVATRYSGKRAKVVGFNNNKVSLQLFDDYFSYKIGTGSEKAELGVMSFSNKREAEIIDEVFESIFNADIVHNANIIKHDPWNTVFNQYTNLLSDSINSAEDAAYANKILSTKLGEGNPHILKYNKEYKRWTLVEAGYTSVDDNFNTPVKIKSAIDEMMNSGSGFGNRLRKNISMAEKNRVFMTDIVMLKDNTIQNAQGGKNIGKGATISSKGLSIMGKQIGDVTDPRNFGKYGEFKNGKFASNWEPIKSHLEKMIIDDPKNQRLANQTGRIQGVLSYINGDKGIVNGFDVDKFSEGIKDITLDEVITPNGLINVDQLSDIFTYSDNGPKAYRIKIDDTIGIKDFRTHDYLTKSIIENSNGKIDIDVAKRRAEEILKKRGYKDTISEIIIPAIDPNRAGDQVTLSSLQKSYADLLNDIKSLKDGSFEGITYQGMITKINNDYVNVAKNLVFELNDKKGIAKRGTKTKALFSSRSKMMKIAAPVVKNGQYVDLDFRNTSTKYVGGKVKYEQVAFRNLQDIIGADIGEEAYENKLESIGRQLINGEVNNSDKMFDVFNKYIKNNNLNKANSLDEARKILQGSNMSKGSLIGMAEDFFEQVGFDSIVTRDPTFKDESYQIVKTFSSKTVTRGSSMVDSVAASFLNADSDGDEIAFINHLFSESGDGNIVIKTQNHVLTRASNTIRESMHDDNAERFKKLIKKREEAHELFVQKKAYTLEGYIDNALGKSGDGVIKTISTSNSDAYREIIARLTKDKIGPISNSNYYLRGATESYINSVIGKESIESVGEYTKTIQTFARHVEQGIIDVKSIKNVEDSKKALERISGYGKSLDNIAAKMSPASEARAFTFLTENLDFLIKDGVFDAGGLDLSLTGNAKAVNVSEMVERVLAGEVIKSTKGSNKATFEEALLMVKNVLQSDSGRAAYVHMAVRQSSYTRKLGTNVSLETNMTEAVGEDFVKYVDSIFGKKSAIAAVYDTSLIDDSITVRNNFGGDKVVQRGEVLYNTTNNPGMYRLKETKRGLQEALLELEDLDSKKTVLFSGKTFGDISEQLKVAGYTAEFGETIGDLGQTYDELLDEDGFIKLSAKVVEQTKENKEKMIKSSLDEFVKARDGKFGLNSNNINENITKDILNSLDLDAQEDLLSTARILENEKYYSDSQSKKFIDSMNEKIKKHGTKNYRRLKEQALLENAEFAKKYSLNSSNIGGFIDGNLGREKIKNTSKKTLYSGIMGKMDSMKRIDVDSIINGITGAETEYINNLAKILTERDTTIANEIFNLTSGHIEDLEFQSMVLGWDLDGIDNLLKNNQGSLAMDKIGAAKIAYGKYTGYSINNLSDELLTEILSEQTDGVPNEVKAKMHSIINKTRELQNSGIERNINTNGLVSANEDSFIKEAVEQMNEKIKEKGKKLQNSSDNSILSKGKSLFEKLEDTMKSSSNKSKLKYVALASATAVAAGAYLFGGDIKDTKSSSFNKSPDEKTNMKTDPYAKGKKSRSVPMTDSRFYEAQDTGLNINVTGNASRNSSATDTSSRFENMFKGRGVNLNTNISDTRRQINEKEIEDIMFNSSY